MKPKLVANAHSDRSVASKMRVISPEQIVELRKCVALESSYRCRRRRRLESSTPLRLVRCGALLDARL